MKNLKKTTKTRPLVFFVGVCFSKSVTGFRFAVGFGWSFIYSDIKFVRNMSEHPSEENFEDGEEEEIVFENFGSVSETSLYRENQTTKTTSAATFPQEVEERQEEEEEERTKEVFTSVDVDDELPEVSQPEPVPPLVFGVLRQIQFEVTIIIAITISWYAFDKK